MSQILGDRAQISQILEDSSQIKQILEDAVSKILQDRSQISQILEETSQISQMIVEEFKAKRSAPPTNSAITLRCKLINTLQYKRKETKDTVSNIFGNPVKKQTQSRDFFFLRQCDSSEQRIKVKPFGKQNNRRGIKRLKS